MASMSTWLPKTAKFLILHGLPAYIPDTKPKLGAQRQLNPCIFNMDEIKSIFDIADNLYSGRSHIRSYDFYPVILRLLYSSGMRISEALRLAINDVDLGNGAVFVKNGKNRKDRLLPLNPQMVPCLSFYAGKYHALPLGGDYFFSPPHGGCYSKGAACHRFRDILFKCGISHGGREKGGPRLHGLRHTFCVHSLRQFLANGVGHRAALPVPQVYMGHSSIAATAKYLRLAADACPEIPDKIGQESGGLMPVREAPGDGSRWLCQLSKQFPGFVPCSPKKPGRQHNTIVPWHVFPAASMPFRCEGDCAREGSYWHSLQRSG
ncbi:MAG: tyrosine-type recombinase/integrase [Eubacteriaceae bacterium]|nr:tyrosine-type recombinase/integrase [Eubacteriaceae bacterium]